MLKDSGVPVTPRELLDLLEAMEQRLAFGDMDDFYALSRAVLVKDEKYYDRFDRAFGLHFQELEALDDVIEAMIPDDWLRSEFLKQLSEEDKAKIESLGGLEELIEQFKQRLEEQKKRHSGGNKWIGTEGTSPFGNDGYHPEGIRVGGESKNKRAAKVWDRRDFKNLDDSVELGTRNIKIAMRRLRKFARTGATEDGQPRGGDLVSSVEQPLLGCQTGGGAEEPTACGDSSRAPETEVPEGEAATSGGDKKKRRKTRGKASAGVVKNKLFADKVIHNAEAFIDDLRRLNPIFMDARRIGGEMAEGSTNSNIRRGSMIHEFNLAAAAGSHRMEPHLWIPLEAFEYERGGLWLTTEVNSLPSQLEALRNDAASWLSLLEEHSANGTVKDTAVFVGHCAMAEIAAKIAQAVLTYAKNNIEQIREEAVQADNWEHEGFSVAFSGNVATEVTKRMWGEFALPENWTIRSLMVRALVEAR